MDIASIFKEKLTLTEWSQIITRKNYAYAGVVIPGLRQEVFEKSFVDTDISVGVFYYNNILTYIAWGLKEKEHCSYHALVYPEGKMGEVKEGCPNVIPVRNNTGIVTGFTLDGQQICSIEDTGIQIFCV